MPRSGVSASAALAREAFAIQTSRSAPLPPLPSPWEGHARDPAWDCNIFESPRGFINVFSSTQPHHKLTSTQHHTAPENIPIGWRPMRGPTQRKYAPCPDSRANQPRNDGKPPTQGEKAEREEGCRAATVQGH